MLVSSREINDLMKAQLCIYKEIESLLDKTVNNKQGSVWAYEQVKEIDILFSKLKVLDEQRNKIVVSTTTCAVINKKCYKEYGNKWL